MKPLELPPDDERLVQAFRALGNPMRFRILQTLAEQQACVCGDLVDLLPLAQSTVSGHLKVLKEAGLIQGAIEGPSTCYCLDPGNLGWLRQRVALLFAGPEPAAVGAAIHERSFAVSNQTPASSDAVKEAVSARYASIARQQLVIPLEVVPAADACCAAPVAAGACCAAGEAEACATGSCGAGYSAEDLAGLPSSVTGVSLGCGAPVGLAEARPGETVLDLGSGGGIDCFLAARRVGPEGRVIGVDMTPEMVRLARANAREVGAANVEFRLGEIEHLPVDPDSVDLAISNCVVNLAPDKPAVFREVFRVLRPGGRLVLADTATEQPVREELRARLDLWGQCMSGSLDRATYLAALRDAGFAQVEVLDEREFRSDEQGGMPTVLSLTVRAVKPA